MLKQFLMNWLEVKASTITILFKTYLSALTYTFHIIKIAEQHRVVENYINESCAINGSSSSNSNCDTITVPEIHTHILSCDSVPIQSLHYKCKCN